ncbi:expressed unknown protein [Seminavis robusta]|uniref:Uncharacterized protein n=1 Tax=Seminavis robusta TaxID=568900 RepID=A0A9N8EPR8_9STRA|nr:expressed unknown protein [Seminavis robusta]|eukprot:Sro1549_g281660.1 n/a (1263) ;mRNA; f:16761-20807
MGLLNTNRTDSDPTLVESVTSQLIDDKFCKNGEFHAATAKKFVEELRERRDTLQQQVHDTRYSERILRDVNTHRSASKNAHKKSTFGGSPVLLGLDKVIIPLADQIAQMIADGADKETIQSVAEEFVRVYSPYETPNLVVTAWNNNNQVWAAALKIITPWTTRKDDTKKDTLESVNLDVEEPDHVQEVSKILGRDIASGYRLTKEDTEALKEGDFDLSRLNPGSTAFWSRPNSEGLAMADEKVSAEYPRSDEKVTYLSPRYRSKFSTKMTGYVMRNGEKHRFKIKLGAEVHSEIIVIRLRQYMGFHQDQMRHYPQLKMYLGDKSYAQWERDLQLKYGTEQLRRHILQRGQDEETGEAWVVFRDVAIEARPKTQIRVSAVDYGAYDGSRSREVRASALIYAFTAQGDHSTKNSREVLVQDEDGEYQVEHRVHDVGLALGRAPVVLQDSRDVLNFPLSKNKPEEYDRNYVWADKEGNKVSFIWNDFWHHLRDHSGATFSDFKWSARLIGSLTTDEIREAVVSGGIPTDLVESYVYHISNMRNRAVRAFALEQGEGSVPGRGPIQLTVPEPPTDLVRSDGYEVIKKGKIVGNYYPGSTVLPLLQETWFTRINGLFQGQSIGRDIGAHYVEASFAPLVRLDTHVGRTLWEREVPWTMTTFSVGIGLNATVARIVKPNRLYVGAEGRSRAYVVHDTLSFSVGVGFPAVSSALAKLGPEFSVTAELYRRRFQHVHFAESVSAGYRSPVQVHKITRLGNIESLAVAVLTPGDVLREFQAIGATSAVHLGFGLGNYIGSVGSSLSFEGGQTNWQTVTYTKDQLGSLHLLLENDSERTFGAGTEQFNVTANSVVNAAAFALGAHSNRINYKVWNIEVAPKEYDLEQATDGIKRSGSQAEELVATLKTLRRHPELALPEVRAASKVELPDNVKLRFRIQANKLEKRSNAQLLYLFNHDRKKEKTRVTVESDEYQYDFFSKSRSKRGYAGIEKTVLDLKTKNSVVREGTSKRLTVEMDRQNPRSLVVWVDVFDYKRTLDRRGLLKLLDSLNKRYQNPDDEGADFFVEPPMPTEEPYKRIYANSRIYVNGDKLIKLVEEKTPKELFAEIQSVAKDPIGFHNKRKIKQGFKQLTKAVEELNKLTPGEDAEKQTIKVQDRLAVAALRLVNALYQSKTWGVSYLHKLFGSNGMLVVGEVFGVHERTNMLQDPDWVSRLRYAGKSWGKLTNVPPISRFVRVDQPTPANEHAMLDIPMERFLGTIVTGYSGGMVGLGSR